MKEQLFGSLLLVVLFSVDLSQACSCLNSHPQQQYCDSDYVLKGKVQKINQTAPTPNENGNFYLRFELYQVSIYQIFKGEELLAPLVEGSSGLKVKLRIPRDSCEIRFTEETDYLISGYKDGDYLSTTLCSWTRLWTELTHYQRRYLRAVYPVACYKSCKIKSYFEPGCKDGRSDDNSCCLPRSYPAANMQGKCQTCSRSTNSSACAWTHNICASD